jgi:hypothetical protein
MIRVGVSKAGEYYVAALGQGIAVRSVILSHFLLFIAQPPALQLNTPVLKTSLNDILSRLLSEKSATPFLQPTKRAHFTSFLHPHLPRRPY